MQYFLRQGGNIGGPWDVETIRRVVSAGDWTAEAEAVEAMGQTAAELEESPNWIPVAAVLTEGFQRDLPLRESPTSRGDGGTVGAAGAIAGLVLVAAGVFLLAAVSSLAGFALAAVVIAGGVQAFRMRDKWLVLVAAGLLAWYGIRLLGRDGVETMGGVFIAGAFIAVLAALVGWDNFRRPLPGFGRRVVYVDPAEARIAKCELCGMPAPEHTAWCPTRKKRE